MLEQKKYRFKPYLLRGNMNKFEISLSSSQLSRQLLDSLGLPKSVSIKNFKSTLLPKIPYHIELRGVGFGPKQRHTKTYYVSDIKKFLFNFFQV